MEKKSRREIITVQNEDKEKESRREISGGLLVYWFIGLLGYWWRRRFKDKDRRTEL